jgi:SAM-dependent methyltransferase
VADRWNHNIHLHRVALDAVPPGARRALDVGCGEGLLAGELTRAVPHVVGMDLHEPSLALGHDAFPDVSFVRADLFAHPFPAASFDLVASVATLHHVDARAGLRAMAELVRPGGVLAVVGLARTRLPRDLPWELAGAVSTRAHKLRRTYWEHTSPMAWPPPETYRGMREIIEQELPGATFRRHVLWRWWCTWTRPA